MKLCVIIPTLNEEKNIYKLFKRINKTKVKLDILYIDDNSLDKTQSFIKELKKKNKNIKYIFRKNRTGIGSAHKEGIKFCYKKKYDLIITMDGDGTHDPKYFKQMISNSKKFDYVITSRFKKPNLLKDWPLSRKILTYSRHFIVKFFLGINFDASGAYRCFSVKKMLSVVHAFQWTCNFLLFCLPEFPHFFFVSTFFDLIYIKFNGYSKRNHNEI